MSRNPPLPEGRRPLSMEVLQGGPRVRGTWHKSCQTFRPWIPEMVAASFWDCPCGSLYYSSDCASLYKLPHVGDSSFAATCGIRSAKAQKMGFQAFAITAVSLNPGSGDTALATSQQRKYARASVHTVCTESPTGASRACPKSLAPGHPSKKDSFHYVLSYCRLDRGPGFLDAFRPASCASFFDICNHLA